MCQECPLATNLTGADTLSEEALTSLLTWNTLLEEQYKSRFTLALAHVSQAHMLELAMHDKIFATKYSRSQPLCRFKTIAKRSFYYENVTHTVLSSFTAKSLFFGKLWWKLYFVSAKTFRKVSPKKLTVFWHVSKACTCSCKELPLITILLNSVSGWEK